MYKDYHFVEQAAATTASTPEMWAKNFAGATPLNARKARQLRRTKLFELISREIAAGGRVLDAGCGAGDWVAFLEQAGYRAEGCDYSAELLERTRRTYPHITWTQTDIRSMPYGDATFDGIVSWGVIEHDEQGPGAALREFRRVLKSGGTAVLTVPRDSRQHRAASDYLYNLKTRPCAFFQYLFTPDELRDTVKAEGFEIVEYGTVPGAELTLVSPRFARHAPRVLARLANIFVARLLSRFERYRVMTYCVARKP
ncbi:MAG TPA: class I SAM-dependent methyltransferase [Thermoanaerobaculia bacterium]|nr:class I SAM-dependent methyltransferase [Thermoanaerobaculia bacterium]